MTAAAEQLERIAVVAPPPPVPPVRIYQLAREFEWTCWLCEACLALWLEARWQIRGRKSVGHQLTCDGPPQGPCVAPRGTKGH